MARLEFLFDVGGPNGYLAYRVLPEIVARTGAELHLVPVLLGGIFKATGNRAPIFRYADAPAKWAYEQLEFNRFVKAHALDAFRLNPHFPLNSLMAMRIITASEGSADYQAVIETMMRTFWEEGLKADEGEVLVGALDRAGLDGAGLLARSGEAEVKARLAAHTEAAVTRGAFGIPTFFVGNEMFWGKERLAQVEAALLAA